MLRLIFTLLTYNLKTEGKANNVRFKVSSILLPFPILPLTPPLTFHFHQTSKR